MDMLFASILLFFTYIVLSMLLFMRLFLIILTFFVTQQADAQGNYNKWSLEASLGLNNAIGPFAEGYSSNYLTFAHVDGGARRMFNNMVGLKLDAAFDRIKNDEWGNIQGPDEFTKSGEFQTHYFRLSLQTVLNVGHVLRLYELDKNFSALLHFGFGFSSLKNQKRSVWFKDWHSQGSDEMVNYILGITPQYRVHDKWAVYFDASLVANAWQSKTWDFTENNFQKGLHGRILNFSVGVCYYLGSSSKHLDWVFTPAPLPEVDTIQLAKKKPKENVELADENLANTKINLPDEDNDGIPDDEDDCPAVYGRGPNGCPNFDTDKDGVPDSQDACPETKGVVENNGCPELDLYVKKVFNEAMNDVDFEVNQDVLMDDSYAILDKVVKVLNEYPEFKLLEVHGHTDNSGHAEPNMILSKARAIAVVNYLVSKGIDPVRLEAIGHGGTKPIAANDNPAGREQNERIDFSVRYE